MIPYPNGQILAGGIFQSGNIIQILVVQNVMQRCECFLQVRKIQKPAGFRRYRTVDADFYAKRMTMQTGAFMARRNLWQAVGGFKTKLANQGDYECGGIFHGRILTESVPTA